MRELSDAARKQGALWGKRAREWAEIQEAIERNAWQLAFEALGVSGGRRVLDCGCGAGGALILASEAGAVPSGFDPSVNMLTIARERMPNADLRIGELESIPWPNAEFDCAMAINSLQFAQNPQLAVHEMGRVCKEDGMVAVAVWDEPDNCDLGRVYNAILDLFAKPPRGRGVFALSDRGRLEALFDAVRDLTLDRVEVMDCRAEYGSVDEAINGQMSTGATQRAVEIFGEDAVRDAIRSAIDPLIAASGSVRMHNRCKVALARKL